MEVTDSCRIVSRGGFVTTAAGQEAHEPKYV